MPKQLLIALVLSSSVQSTDSSYWEEVFNTSMQRQAEAKLANFSDFPLDKDPSSAFGMRIHPITQENKLHHGVDFPGNLGDPFKVVAHGEVIFAGENGSLGMTISVDHGNGLITRYGHANTLKYAVGDKVRRGDEIGTVGATGVVTGPHLHFEVMQDGEYIDPEAFIAQRRAINVEEYKNQLIQSAAVDLDSYVQNQLKNNQAISNETFEGFSVENSANEHDEGNNNQDVPSISTLPSNANDHTDEIVEQILDEPSVASVEDTTKANSQPDVQGVEIVDAKTSEPAPLGATVPEDVSSLDLKDFQKHEEMKNPSEGVYTKRTLWAIADEIKPIGSTVYQSMYAIFELNPHAFSNDNMNLRYLDTPLKLPDSSTIATVDPAKAKSKYYEDLAKITGEKKVEINENAAPQ